MKTHYILVEWLHTVPSEPIRLYYELDLSRRELRKVEEYRDGTLHSADASHGQGNTFLAWEAHPPVTEIQKDPQFRVSELLPAEFERVWQQAGFRILEPAAA